jgi:rubredoxin
MSKLEAILLIVFVSGLVVLVFGGLLHGLRDWRRCAACRWFYDEEGVKVAALPGGTPEPVADGECAECRAERELQTQEAR